MSRAEHERRADVVFVGVADSEAVDGSPRTVFTVERVVKGSAGSRVTVDALSTSEAPWAIRFTVGARYEVYVRRDGDRLTTNLCAGNRTLDLNDRRPVETASDGSMRPADSVRDFGPGAPWPAIAGWGVRGAGADGQKSV